MTQLAVSPDGFWTKTHFYRQGTMLHAVTYSCIAGNPEIFRASVDLKPILAKVVRLHAKLHKDGKVSGASDVLVGFSFNPIKAIGNVAKTASNMVNKIGKSKLVSQVASTARSVIKSKVTGAVLAGTAFVFPPVGAPAVAAYVAANAALVAIDQASAAMKTAKQIADKVVPDSVKKSLKKKLSSWAGSVVKKAVADGRPIPTQYKGTIAQAIKLSKDHADQAKQALTAVKNQAKAGNVEAQKLARIVSLAHNAREQLKHIAGSSTVAHHSSKPTASGGKHHRIAKMKSKGPSVLNGFPAVLITDRGKIIPGRYVERSGSPTATVIRGGKAYRGSFAAVSGVFGPRQVVGCHNPFMSKSAEAR